MNGEVAFERRLGRVLTVGLAVTTPLLAVGLLLLFVMLIDPAVASAALNGGIIVLIGTPMVPVLLAIVAFIRQRDWLFVVVTLIVLLELAATVWRALAVRNATL